MRHLRLSAVACAALVLLALPATAAARRDDGTLLHLVGKGQARFAAQGDGAEFATLLRRGSAKLIGDSPTAIRLVCVDPRRRRCARYNRRTQTWVVSYPVRFLYEGTDFTLVLRSQLGFDVGIAGTGRLLLNGTGRYTMNGETTRYKGPTRIRLR